MNEVVERVARAICDSIVVECHNHATASLDYKAAARAAIEAMREPSVAMWEASLKAGSYHPESWLAMIQAALDP